MTINLHIPFLCRGMWGSPGVIFPQLYNIFLINDFWTELLFCISDCKTLLNHSFQAEEWLEIVEQQFYPWAAQYLITERVSIEPNFHELYLQFVETLCQKDYASHVLTETYNNIKVCRCPSCNFSRPLYMSWKLCARKSSTISWHFIVS